jgi:hypothetical protein
MSFATEIHAIGLKTGAKSDTALSMNGTRKGTAISMAPTTTSPTGCNEGGGGLKAFSHDLKRVHWPLNFKSSGIKKYDGSTNPYKWLEVYQLTIEAADGTHM